MKFILNHMLKKKNAIKNPSIFSGKCKIEIMECLNRHPQILDGCHLQLALNQGDPIRPNPKCISVYPLRKDQIPFLDGVGCSCSWHFLWNEFAVEVKRLDGLGGKRSFRNVVAHVDGRFWFRLYKRFREVRVHTIQIVRGWLGLLNFATILPQWSSTCGKIRQDFMLNKSSLQHSSIGLWDPFSRLAATHPASCIECNKHIIYRYLLQLFYFVVSLFK